MALALPNRNRIAEVIRRDAGRIEVNFKDDVKVEEIAAMMVGITNTAQEMGWGPGRLMREYEALRHGQRLIPVPGLDERGNGGNDSNGN